MITKGIMSMIQFYNAAVRQIISAKKWASPTKYNVLQSDRYDILFIGDNRVMLFNDSLTASDYTINAISKITNENVILEEEEIRIGADIIEFTWIDVGNIK